MLGKSKRNLLAVVVGLLVALACVGCTAFGNTSNGPSSEGSASGSASVSVGSASSSGSSSGVSVSENGEYTSKDEVAAYIHLYGHLPSNFISKTQARKAGWDSQKGNLDEVCPGKSIGGSRYYDYDNQLPAKRGRTWTECDINYHGGYRGAERIVFSNDGLIYYTGDHYETFERLY